MYTIDDLSSMSGVDKDSVRQIITLLGVLQDGRPYIYVEDLEMLIIVPKYRNKYPILVPNWLDKKLVKEYIEEELNVQVSDELVEDIIEELMFDDNLSEDVAKLLKDRVVELAREIVSNASSSSD